MTDSTITPEARPATASLSPEQRAGLWKRLAALAGVIGDAETKAQYLSQLAGALRRSISPCTPRPDR
jgi:hypothetical protein